jgi:hypothetical protein
MALTLAVPLEPLLQLTAVLAITGVNWLGDVTKTVPELVQPSEITVSVYIPVAAVASVWLAEDAGAVLYPPGPAQV